MYQSVSQSLRSLSHSLTIKWRTKGLDGEEDTYPPTSVSMFTFLENIPNATQTCSHEVRNVLSKILSKLTGVENPSPRAVIFSHSDVCGSAF